jgi:formylglycine-generating enzyme required for sulfatase activity
MRLIRVSAFRIDRREVTAADYDRCAAAKGCAARDCGEATAPEATPGAPATCVSWFDATAYCAWVAGRLPTEAEWEKAARSRDGRKYPWGGEAPTCERALFNECGNESADPVGSHPAGASPYGVEDLAGNVAEWVADWYDGAYYRDSPETDPTGPAEGEAKVVRGGSWATGSRLLMTGYRSFAPPLERREDLGFRCAWPVR